VSTRWGFNPKARQIRETADWLKPVALAMERVDQWVASAGMDSSVSASTRSMSSSPSLRGVPGRDSSSRLSRPPSRKRRRHLPTVCSVAETCCAMAVLLSPSAASKTIRARMARACAVLRRRLHERSCWRCSSPIDSGGSGRPFGIGVLPLYPMTTTSIFMLIILETGH